MKAPWAVSSSAAERTAFSFQSANTTEASDSAKAFAVARPSSDAAPKVRQRDAGQDIYFGRRNRCMIARVDPRLPDMILASSGEEDFFVKKSRKAAFEPKTFLAKVGDGKTITEYQKDQVVFSQGGEADAVFYIQKGKIKLTVVSERGKEAVVGVLEPDHFFGEGCLNGHPLRVTTATAIDQCLITRITKAAMIATLHDEPEFSQLFMADLLSSEQSN